MTSFASGIRSESSAVSQALQSVLQRAIDNLDYSGLAKKLDQKMGDAMRK
jgi:hypothetical protein